MGSILFSGRDIIMWTYINTLQLPIVWIDISENTVRKSVLFQSLDSAANKCVFVPDLSVIFLLDAILNKMVRS